MRPSSLDAPCERSPPVRARAKGQLPLALPQPTHRWAPPATWMANAPKVAVKDREKWIWRNLALKTGEVCRKR